MKGRAKHTNQTLKSAQSASLLNSRHVRQILDCSSSTLTRLGKNDRLPYKYFPGLGRRWKPEDVQRFISETGI